MAYCAECGERIEHKNQCCWETGGKCYPDPDYRPERNRDDIAIYKGRKYKLLWSGKTKYGRRAKLGFFDGSKEFWVDADRIS